MIAQHIGEIAILVRDYDEAIFWFTQKLGFILKEDNRLPNGERWVTVGPSNAKTMLRLARAENAEQTGQIGGQAKGRVLCYLHTDDFARDHKAMVALGVRFIERPRNKPYGTVAVFEDLYGNLWDLIQQKA